MAKLESVRINCVHRVIVKGIFDQGMSVGLGFYVSATTTVLILGGDTKASLPDADSVSDKTLWETERLCPMEADIRQGEDGERVQVYPWDTPRKSDLRFMMAH